MNTNQKHLINKGMKIAVMGFGVTGRAAGRYALSCGADVLVSDSGDAVSLEKKYGEYFTCNDIEWEAGGHTFEFLSRADLVIVSPGIPLDLPVFVKLDQEEIPVVGELAVAAPLLDMPVAAVTGTNGKTTVTALLGHLLKEADHKVFVGGNIGTPLLDYLREPEEIDCMVLEVSSFQLEMAGNFSPEIGILLNITPDHLDRHGTLDEYAAAKKLLFSNGSEADLAILNGDDRYCIKMAGSMAQKSKFFGQENNNDCVITESEIRLEDEIYDLTGTALNGWIGAANSAAAVLAARRWDVAADDIRKGLKSFVPAPHRLQYAGTIGGVSYINDSKATNTGAVIAALNTFQGGVHLIAGGRDKGEDYRQMARSVADKVCQLILIGEAAAQMEEALAGICPLVKATSLKEAVQLAAQKARSGDTVLLSPACASFDMFKSYGHRGEVFMNLVHGLEDTADR